MKFSNFSKVYNEVYPKAKPVTSKIVTTATKPKDISNEVNDEIVDNDFVEENPVVEERAENNGTGADNQLNNE